MKQVITKLFLFLFLFTTVNCGFKVINESEKNNFSIQEIKTSGDKRINFKIKNNLLSSSKKNNQNTLLINLSTKKTKNIKEKNIKNEIIKYELKIIAEIEYLTLGDGNSGKFILSESGDYEVAKIYSNTLNNEKNLVKILTDKISNKINENLIKIVNDL